MMVAAMRILLDMEGSGSEYEKEEVEVEADKQW